jgi:hypothetical protein
LVAPATTFVIVETHYAVPARGEAPYYEIVAGADQARDTPHVTVITRDPAIVARALLLEGSEERVQLTWHHERGPRKTRLVLETMQ